MSSHHRQTRSPDSRIPGDELTIKDFTAEFAAEFKRLNVEWITQHWALEDADR